MDAKGTKHFLANTSGVMPLYADMADGYGWRYDAVKYVTNNGIMNGISGTGRFDPDEPLTSGQCLQRLFIVWKAHRLHILMQSSQMCRLAIISSVPIPGQTTMASSMAIAIPDYLGPMRTSREKIW